MRSGTERQEDLELDRGALDNGSSNPSFTNDVSRDMGGAGLSA
jgi:hypothetical protein